MIGVNSHGWDCVIILYRGAISLGSKSMFTSNKKGASLGQAI